MAPQLIGTNGLFIRGLVYRSAMSSLPTPLSPSKTELSVKLP